MSAPRLPQRPRLGEHVVARRHVADGRERVVLQESAGGGLVRLEPGEWRLLECADGTRDLDGVLLAASRAGADARYTDALALFELLQRVGMLVDGVRSARPRAAAPPTPPTRPLETLPGYAFRCNGRGGCCAQYSTVLFAPDEATRARAHVPLLPHAADFTPDRGSVPAPGYAVAMVDGRCAYLRADSLCSIHGQAGAQAKPSRCRLFPVTLVDDGVTVRVSVLFECLCVVESDGAPDAEPLIAPEATTLGALEPGTACRALPESIEIAAGVRVPREAIASWSRAVVAAPFQGDAASALFALAAALETHGADPDTAVRALQNPARAAADDVRAWLEVVEARARVGVEANAAFRSESDRARWTTLRVAEAATAGRAPGAAEAALASDGRSAERLYFRAIVFGHHAVGAWPLAPALRDRGMRILLARMLGAEVNAGRGIGAADDPLTLVEMVMRAHGVSASGHTK